MFAEIGDTPPARKVRATRSVIFGALVRSPLPFRCGVASLGRCSSAVGTSRTLTNDAT